MRPDGSTGADPLGAFFDARGAVRVETPILQPADPYLDTAGEAFRRRIFLTRGEGGEALCLRPDFTIPVCIAHIAAGAGLPRRYAYDGTIFRQRGDGASEFRQAGIEDLGDADRAGADARALAAALEAMALLGLDGAGLTLVLGDQALFEAFLKGLGLPAGWQRRLVRTFGHDGLLERALGDLSRGGDAGLAGIDPHIADLARQGRLEEIADDLDARMEAAGLPPHRRRTGAEIAARLAEKVADADTRLDAGALAQLRAFLSIDCPLSQAVAALKASASGAGAGLGTALAFFEARNAALERAGLDLAGLRYRAAFGRPIDYYTGLVFEIAQGGGEPLAAGGRYDRLVSYLGAREPIPAVGFSVWMDRAALAKGAA
ncbi:ATP phosphoribosyltransferase regulatory subunit [Aurantimonas sp. Leaf443]|nr:ATP phosphoribosyltransferase regulatory subunit [Aurantimonas sp. Leaf443]